ncbi:MAG: hypothetical protein ACYTXA_12325 [Nostoc sp.]
MNAAIDNLSVSKLDNKSVSDRLLSKSKRCLRRAIRRRLAEILKNKAIAFCGRVCDRFAENLKNKP